jgi:acetyl-CoA synthetase
VIKAIIFEPNDPSEEALHISYNELHQRVCKMANVFAEQGIIKEIEFVFIYQ